MNELEKEMHQKKGRFCIHKDILLVVTINIPLYLTISYQL